MQREQALTHGNGSWRRAGRGAAGEVPSNQWRTEKFVSETRNLAQNEGSRTSAVRHRLPVQGWQNNRDQERLVFLLYL